MAIDTQTLVHGLLYAGSEIANRKKKERELRLAAQLKARDPETQLRLQQLRNEGQYNVANLKSGTTLSVEELRAELRRALNTENNDTRVKVRGMIEEGDANSDDKKFTFGREKLAVDDARGRFVASRRGEDAYKVAQLNAGSREKIAAGAQGTSRANTLTSADAALKRANIAAQTSTKNTQARVKSSERNTEKNIEGRVKVAKVNAWTTLRKAGIDHTAAISLRKLANEHGMEVARLAAKTATENTHKRVQAQLQVAGLKGGKAAKSPIQAAQLKSFDEELKQIAQVVTDPKNYKNERGLAMVNRMVERRNRILAQIRAMETAPAEAPAPVAAPSPEQRKALSVMGSLPLMSSHRTSAPAKRAAPAPRKHRVRMNF